MRNVLVIYHHLIAVLAGDFSHQLEGFCSQKDLQLQNRFIGLAGEKELGGPWNGASLVAKPEPLRPITIKQQVTVVADSLLQATEAPTCQSNLSSREVCCLLVAHTRDVVKRLQRHNCSLGSPSTALPDRHQWYCRGELQSRENDYRTLGTVVKDVRILVVFS